jgi:hypothetical protein
LPSSVSYEQALVEFTIAANSGSAVCPNPTSVLGPGRVAASSAKRPTSGSVLLASIPPSVSSRIHLVASTASGGMSSNRVSAANRASVSR